MQTDIKNKEITAENVVDVMTSQVKRFNNEPQYYLRINKNYCLVEMLVNEDIIYKDYKLSNLATPHNITYSILKSGTQTLTYRLYPVENLVKQEYGYGDTVTTLVDNTSLSISIIEVDNRSAKKLDDEKVVMTHTIKTDKDGNFIGSGKPYYEFTFEFEAKIPYEIEGYTKGQDLRKVNSILLRPKVFQFYKKIKSLYLSKNKDENSKLRYNEIFRICQSNLLL